MEVKEKLPCLSVLLSASNLRLLHFVLFSSNQGTVKQAYTNAPVVDNELLRLSLRLFKKKTTCHAPGPEKADEKLPQPSVQQELCVS